MTTPAARGSAETAVAGGDRRHIFTVDVEEYFQVSAFEGTVSRGEWEVLPSRVALQVDLLLEALATHDVRATFFVLGWVANRHAGVVRRIAAAGHEVASHGWWHRRVSEMSWEEFREDVRSAKRTLEDVTGRPVVGFRAPNFSLVPGTEWAFDALIEEGYRYDSSVFPVRWLRAGYPGAPRGPHILERPEGELLEVPASTARWAGLRIPAAGGAYFRHLPYAVTRRSLEQAELEGRPGVLYLHPWELDAHQPRLSVPAAARIRHYRNLERTLPRLHRVLREFRFTSVVERLGLDRAVRGGGAYRALTSR